MTIETSESMSYDLPSSSSDDLNDTSTQTTSGAGSSASGSASSKKTTKKKTAKKPAAKKTTKKVAKKPAAKKTTKKVAKKPVAKKTAKKTTKKTTKKAAAKSEAAQTEQVEAPEVEAPEVEMLEEAASAESDVASQDAEDSASRPASKKTTKKTAKRSSKRAPRRAPAPGDALESGDITPSEQADAEMIVNYVPGEECRIAIVEDGQLEEFYSEPTGSVSRVGNIYVGKVTNVESSIQAAFVDFGLPENGFLHSSDIHPRFFPSGSDTEQVGKKTPRRERPPIQQCLKKGQEIIVQVLKEGVGTKGPSLTSYLSVPGRYLVMMPDMDSLGVSRKEEDEEKRREAKRILSQLDIPKNFGFILRTAGFGRTKAELQRDLAYLQRLWLDMEKKRKKGNKPRLLYSESDLLLRSMRDLVGHHITRVVIDDPTALERAARFLKIVSPRSQAKLASYTGARPVFYAFGIEDQIKMINSREVPLRSGGRLIIDQTEALVAIDVNSGKSRGAKDAETNAYKTNLEAVDVICRQLRLRDLGGLVISDLIDMRHLRHRQAIEERFLERLRTDRAKSTILPISQFGILEMTRQRMRGSQESLNFAECQTCRGRGLVQRPDSVTAEALRQLADILQHDKVERAELVVHPKIAGSLLTTRRASMTRVELRSGKKVDVRVSETHALDRVTIYAYDGNGNDIDTERIKIAKRAPEVIAYDPGELPDDRDDGFAADLKAEADAQTSTAMEAQLLKAAKTETDDSILDIAEGDLPSEGDGRYDDGTGEGGKKKRRRRRRGGRGRNRDGEGEGGEQNEQDEGNRSESRPESGNAEQQNESADSEPTYANPQAEDGSSDAEGSEESGENGEGGKKKRRRRRRGGRGRRREGENGEGENGSDRDDQDSGSHESNNASVLENVEAEASGQGPKKPEPIADRDNDSRSDGRSGEESNNQDEGEAPKRKRSRRGGRNRSGSKGEGDSSGDSGSESRPSAKTESKPKASGTSESKPSSSAEPKAPVKKKRRTLYSATRRKLTGAEAERPKE